MRYGTFLYLFVAISLLLAQPQPAPQTQPPITQEDGVITNAYIFPALHNSTYDTEDPITVATDNVHVIDGDGRPMSNQTVYVIELRNEGTADCSDIVMESCLGDKMEFVAAQGPTTYNTKENITLFDPVPILHPGEKLTYKVTGRAIKVGYAKHKATIKCKELDDAIICEEPTTIVLPDAPQSFLAAMHIGMYDTEDPVAVGQTTTYVLEPRNEGASPCSNLILEGQFDDEMEFVSAKGPAAYSVQGNTILFEPVSILQPSKKIKYIITARIIKAGSAKYKVILKYNEFDQPLIREESTTCYKKE